MFTWKIDWELPNVRNGTLSVLFPPSESTPPLLIVSAVLDPVPLTSNPVPPKLSVLMVRLAVRAVVVVKLAPTFTLSPAAAVLISVAALNVASAATPLAP